jgi:hypothetical protein
LPTSSFLRFPIALASAFAALSGLHSACSSPGESPDGGSLGGGGAGETAGAAGGESSTTTLPFAGEPLPGYTLIGSPENDASASFDAFLIDMDGQVVHTWPITGFPPKMLPGGALVGCVGVFPGSYDCVEMQQRSWDGVLEWSFADFVTTPTLSAARHHHDFQREGSPVGYYSPGRLPLASGRTLVLALEKITVPELRESPIRADVIYELDAAGQLSSVVWRSIDHIDEMGFDEEALADIRTQPEVEASLELLHGNAISLVGENPWFSQGHAAFHPENIVYSSRRANFVAILSHETGEIVWRIGPDFESGPERALGQFVGQHFAHIVPQGLPGAGNMLVFDNGGGSGYGGPPGNPNGYRYTREYSRVLEFNPITFEVVWEFGEPTSGTTFFSFFLGSAQRLPNQNTLVTIGTEGRVIEVTPDEDIVWTYQFPAPGTGTLAWVYRAIRVPPEWLPSGVNESLADLPSWAELYEGGALGGAGGDRP